MFHKFEVINDLSPLLASSSSSGKTFITKVFQDLFKDLCGKDVMNCISRHLGSWIMYVGKLMMKENDKFKIRGKSISCTSKEKIVQIVD